MNSFTGIVSKAENVIIGTIDSIITKKLEVLIIIVSLVATVILSATPIHWIPQTAAATTITALLGSSGLLGKNISKWLNWERYAVLIGVSILLMVISWTIVSIEIAKKTA